MYVIFENVKYTLFPAKYSGISYLTGKRFEKNTNIYWNTQYKRGFTENEYNQQIKQVSVCTSAEASVYTSVPTVNTEWTYDDSVSRRRAMQVFKKEFGIELKEHQGEYTKIDDEYILTTDGKYCVDLYALNEDKKSFIYVEVERTKNKNLFDLDNADPIHILVSKFHKYFRNDCKSKRYYMCFINEELEKAMIISGADIKTYRGKYKEIYGPNGKIHEVYEVNKKFAKIYDLEHTAEALIDSCLITY